MIVIVMGLPGSGKSYFASRLAAAIHATYISSDKVRKILIARRTYLEKEKELVLKQKVSNEKNLSIGILVFYYNKNIRSKKTNHLL